MLFLAVCLFLATFLFFYFFFYLCRGLLHLIRSRHALFCFFFFFGRLGLCLFSFFLISTCGVFFFFFFFFFFFCCERDTEAVAVAAAAQQPDRSLLGLGCRGKPGFTSEKQSAVRRAAARMISGLGTLGFGYRARGVSFPGQPQRDDRCGRGLFGSFAIFGGS